MVLKLNELGQLKIPEEKCRFKTILLYFSTLFWSIWNYMEIA